MSTVRIQEPASPPTARRIKLPTGVTLPCVEKGPARGAPVVLLHGVTDSWRSFEPLLPHLPASIRAIVPTLRGHGDADRPEGRYRLADFAADVAALLDRLGVGDAILAGHSMGSAVALRFALDFPARTRGLVLLGAMASYRDNPGVVDFWRSCVSTLEDPIDPALALDFQRSTLARPIAPEALETFVGESLKVPARVWRAAFEAMLEDDFPARLGEIRAPALCLWGERDAFALRGDQDRLLDALPAARLEVHEGAGHALHWEDPARCAAALAAFALECGTAARLR